MSSSTNSHNISSSHIVDDLLGTKNYSKHTIRAAIPYSRFWTNIQTRATQIQLTHIDFKHMFSVQTTIPTHFPIQSCNPRQIKGFKLIENLPRCVIKL